MPLSLRDCLETALRNNLSLTIERLNPALRASALEELREPFRPRLDLGGQKSETDMPGTWGIEGSHIAVRSDSLSVGLSQTFAWGTSLRLSASSARTDTTRSFAIFNPSFSGSIQVDLSQPLLRGLGTRVSHPELVKAGRSVAGAETAIRARSVQLAFEVEEAFWNLAGARELLRIEESSLASSRDILARIREAARIGAESGIEILDAEMETARHEDLADDAANVVRNWNERLKKLLNLTAGEAVTVLPLDSVSAEIREISAEDVLRDALARRPEIEIAGLEAADGRSDIEFYRHQALPRLDLHFSFWLPGVSGTKHLYLDDNPLTGIVIDRVVGRRRDSFEDVFKGTYRNWSVDLRLEVPLSATSARSGLARARLACDQGRLRLEMLKRDIEQEVRDAVRELEAKARSVASSARVRELAERRTLVEMQRYRQGLAGYETLFHFTRELDVARAAEIRATAGYRIALAGVDRVRGGRPAMAPERMPE